MMNGGKIIAHQLKKNDVKFMFTLCGGHIAPIYVEAAKIGITVIDVRNEATAVFAADAISRLSNTCGVAVVTAGPGITNSITALKNAQLAQSALLIITGATATLLRGRGALQDINQVAIVRPAVKKTLSINRVNTIGPAIQQAISVAIEGIPGPVFIECPVDLLYEEAVVREWYAVSTIQKNKGIKARIEQWYIRNHLKKLFKQADSGELQTKYISNKPAPSASLVRQLAGMINKANKPVLVIGTGAITGFDHLPELANAICKLGIPVYLSGMARGLLGQHHPLQFHHKRKAALKEADLVILAGLPCDFRLNYGKDIATKAKKVAISLDIKELRKNISPQLAIHGQPAPYLIELQNKINNNPVWQEWKQLLSGREKQREQEIDQLGLIKGQYINPIALFRKLEELLPPNTIIVSDGGDFAATASYVLQPRKPLSWLDSGVFGTLGVGAGFALGAALCNPDDYIFIIYGDGSAGYSLAEFDTFTKLGLKICAVIGNNGCWEQVAREQVTMLGEGTATVIPRSDYQLIASSFSAKGERTETLEEFENAIKKALISMDHGVPYLVNAIIDNSSFRDGSISI